LTETSPYLEASPHVFGIQPNWRGQKLLVKGRSSSWAQRRMDGTFSREYSASL